METNLPQLAQKIASRCKIAKNGCLEWQGAKTSQGYGVTYANGRSISTHRAALAAYLNKPEMLDRIDRTASVFVPQYVLHSCDNPSCCNPKHLRLGTAGDNAEDALSRGRWKKISSAPRKFSPEDIREIREVATSWDGLCDMMKKHRAAQITIKEIIERRTYKYVD